ncbi:MAG: KpsF/GutQ family sugar-phosphate isomerase [Wenzhouxiangellaceae bacterium]
MDPQTIRELARTVLQIEAAAIDALQQRIDDCFVAVCTCLLNCSGRVVVTGIGKSGHIARKLAATLASTGTPAFYLHPAEAHHGDLGMITAGDVVMAISNSGGSDEITRLLPLIKRLGVPLVSLTGNPQSILASEADYHLDVSVSEEACPLGLAPTASTTAALAMGDALAIALLEARGFTSEDFARAHPGGRLGKRLLLRIRDIMHQNGGIPRIDAGATVSEAIVEMSRKGLGLCAVVNQQQQVQGIFTDGDLRRALDSDHRPRQTRVASVMSRSAVTIGPDALAAEAVELMQRHKIQGLLVTDADGILVGALNFQDLLQSGVV